VDDRSKTISEFCDRHQICRATYYNLKKQGRGPRVMRVGSRDRITPEADADWVRDREAEAAAAGRL
jgi:hypothetical protein